MFDDAPVWRACAGPSCSVDYSSLVGYLVDATVHTHAEGAAPVGGSFLLKFRGAGPTVPIPFDATAVMVHDALIALVTIDTLEVNRVTPRNGHGYTWIVTFIDVRLPTEEGQLMDGHHYEKAFVLDDPFQTVRGMCCCVHVC